MVNVSVLMSWLVIYLVTKREFYHRFVDGMLRVSHMCSRSPSFKQSATNTYGPVSAIQLDVIRLVSSKVHC